LLRGLFFVAGLFAACVLFGVSAFAEEPSLSELIADARSAFEERFAQERMFEAIAAYESILAQLDPSRTQSASFVLDRLAQLCYEATTFSPGNTEEDRALFERGKAYGLRSLRLNPEFAQNEDDDFAAAVAHATDPAALLWTADNWGALCGMNPIEGLLQFGKVRTLYERCLAVDESYWGASAHNALGAMLVVTPGPFGGDPEAGIAHLETAVALAPDYLLNRVVRAQYWGFSFDFFGRIDGVRDAAFISSELCAVLDAPVGDWPFWNREAHREAEILLRKLEELTP